MSMPPTLLCVHPHPDDEAISCGGVLAKAVETGVRAVVVTCTGGEEGENLAEIDLAGVDMATQRRQELQDALAALGVRHHHWLGYRDSGMVDTPANDHPDSFHRADLDDAARRLATIIRAERPQVVVSDDETGSYGHPDHIKANRVTVRAVALAADPDAEVDGKPWTVAKRYVHTLGRARLFAVHQSLVASGLASPFGDDQISSPEELPFGTDDALVTTEVDVTPWMDHKRAAMTAYRSQIAADSFFLNTPEEMTGTVFGTEQFVLEDGGRPVSSTERDLFEGLDVAVAGPVQSPTPEGFRAVLGRFATGISVMTAVADGEPSGMTANAVSSVSLEPPLVLVCVDRDAVMADVVGRTDGFALTFLDERQAKLSTWFADATRLAGRDQFRDVATFTATTGSPLLVGGHGWVDCTTWAIYEGGDHIIVVGEVVALGEPPADPRGSGTSPLLYHRGAYGRLADPG